jgi:hypothetical protein
VQTDPHRGLKNVARQGVQIFDTAFAQGLVHVAECLLSDVLGGRPIAQPPRSEKA